MKYCKKCQKEFEDDLIFCPECGSALSHLESEEDKIDPTQMNTEKEVVEQEVVFNNVEQHQEVDEEQIEKYKKEIEVFKRQRKVLVTWGIVLTAFFLLATLVLAGFSVYYVAQDALAAEQAGLPLTEYSRITNAFLWATSFASTLMEGGMVLIVLGAVPNTIKIKNREKIINNSK